MDKTLGTLIVSRNVWVLVFIGVVSIMKEINQHNTFLRLSVLRDLRFTRVGVYRFHDLYNLRLMALKTQANLSYGSSEDYAALKIGKILSSHVLFRVAFDC